MHEMTVEHTHEEIQLLAIDFSTMLFETTAPMPAWRDAYLARDQRPSYAYLLKVLQVLQWLRGGNRWVLKTPQHLEQFPALVDTFPDATFVVTHRDPVSVTASMVTMIAYTAGLTRDRVDLEAMGGYWSTASSACSAAAPTSATSCRPSRRSTCASTSSWRDDLAMVARVYDLAGQPLDARAGGDGVLHGGPPRGRHGAVAYDLAQFGLDAGRARGGPVLLHRALRRPARVLTRPAAVGSNQRMAERRIWPQRRATCTHRYTSSTSPVRTCHPLSWNGIPIPRRSRMTWLPASRS